LEALESEQHCCHSPRGAAVCEASIWHHAADDFCRLYSALGPAIKKYPYLPRTLLQSEGTWNGRKHPQLHSPSLRATLGASLAARRKLSGATCDAGPSSAVRREPVLRYVQSEIVKESLSLRATLGTTSLVAHRKLSVATCDTGPGSVVRRKPVLRYVQSETAIGIQ